jgi:hypothetical protein
MFPTVTTQLPRYVQLVSFAIGDHGKARQVPIMVEQKVQLDGEYASKAKQVLEDLRIAPCGESWTSSPQCIDGRRVNDDTQSPAISR